METLVEASLVHLTPGDLDCYLLVEGESIPLPKDSELLQLKMESLATAIGIKLLSGDSIVASTSVVLQTLFKQSERALKTFTFSAVSGNKPIQAQIAFKPGTLPKKLPEEEEELPKINHIQDKSLVEENKELRALLKQSQESRQELQELITESADQASERFKCMTESLKNITQEKENISSEMLKQKEAIDILETQLSQTLAQLEQANSENQILAEYKKNHENISPPPKPLESDTFYDKLKNLENQFADYQREIDVLSRDKDKMKKEIQELKDKLIAAQVDSSSATKQFIQCQASHLTLKENFAHSQSTVQLLTNENTSLKAEIQALKEQIEKLSELLKESNEEFVKNSQKLIECEDEKTCLKALLKSKEDEILELKAALDRSNRDLLQTKSALEQSNATLEMEQSRMAKNYESLKSYSESTISKLKNNLNEVNNKFSCSKSLLEDQLGTSQKYNSELLESVQKLTSELSAKSLESENLFREKEEAMTEISKMEQYLCSMEDMNQLIKELKQQGATQQVNNQKLQEELNETCEMVSIQSQRNKKAKERIQELTSLCNSQLTKIASLEEELSNHRAYYIPVKDDPVDLALADYLNRRGKPLEIPWIREDPGIYTYGSKKVFVKVEMGNIIIRVGGGFMMIDEFINLHTPAELEKIEFTKKRQTDPARISFIDKYADAVSSDGTSSLTPTSTGKILKEVMKGKFTTMYGIQKRPVTPQKGINSPPLRRSYTTRRLSEVK